MMYVTLACMMPLNVVVVVCQCTIKECPTVNIVMDSLIYEHMLSNGLRYYTIHPKQRCHNERLQ
jgi:hypothetical protein